MYNICIMWTVQQTVIEISCKAMGWDRKRDWCELFTTTHVRTDTHLNYHSYILVIVLLCSLSWHNQSLTKLNEWGHIDKQQLEYFFTGFFCWKVVIGDDILLTGIWIHYVIVNKCDKYFKKYSTFIWPFLWLITDMVICIQLTIYRPISIYNCLQYIPQQPNREWWGGELREAAPFHTSGRQILAC